MGLTDPNLPTVELAEDRLTVRQRLWRATKTSVSALRIAVTPASSAAVSSSHSDTRCARCVADGEDDIWRQSGASRPAGLLPLELDGAADGEEQDV
jgi:hypothetical protein